MKKSKFELELEQLEAFAKAYPLQVPGTALQRVLTIEDGGGYEWCLALGGMNVKKQFFRGKTLGSLLAQAKDFYVHTQNLTDKK